MSDRQLEELMRRPAPGEREASARSYAVARVAFEQRAPTTRRHLGAVPALVTVALVALAVALALTPAGGALADLVREGLGESVDGERPAEPALTELPSDGELLVVSRQGPWVVQSDGSQRLLGRYDEASWSPSGVHVVVSRGRQLSALTPTGEPRWSLARGAPISGARWSPYPGYRVAYLSGSSLRVVGGDGIGDGLEARRVAAAPPAWRPGEVNLAAGEEAQPLAYADRAGRVELVDVDSGRSYWRSGAGERPVQLEWSSDGERLLAVGRRELRIFDGKGRLLEVVAVPAGLPAPAAESARVAAFRPGAHQFALIRAGHRPGQSEVVVLEAERRPGKPRELFAGPGTFSELAWSPDGRSLLVGWPSADQFLFLRPDRPRRVTAVSNVARQFSPGAGGAAAFPRISDWCCPP
jgi:hypothetical protein